MILAYDLGTGGAKAALYDERGTAVSTGFVAYDTTYPRSGWHEQCPEDWWDAIVRSTGILLGSVPGAGDQIAGISLSGQSLAVVPVDSSGRLLRDRIPIWSDTRPHEQTEDFFSRVDRDEWYLATGNGFPAECYSLFKAMWYRDEEPEIFDRTACLLGSKDWINFRLAGRMVTDHSYASGSGAYSLADWQYRDRFFEAARIEPGLFPSAVPSTEIAGGLTRDAARVLGLRAGTPVVVGGVDNSCMALGARNTSAGRVYTSLGSSAWIAVSSDHPIVDAGTRPYVFAHVVPGLYTSAVSIFAAGSSYRWIRDMLFTDMDNDGLYKAMEDMAAQSPVGANRLLFNPSLAGGTSQEPSPHICGGFLGLGLHHDRNDIVRAVMEGVALNLGSVLTILKKFVSLEPEMLVVGGGSRSPLWRQVLADVYRMPVIKTNVDQDAASLGAAAIGAVGVGIWKNFDPVERIHVLESREEPHSANSREYQLLAPVFEKVREAAAQIGEMFNALEQ